MSNHWSGVSGFKRVFFLKKKKASYLDAPLLSQIFIFIFDSPATPNATPCV